MSRRRLLLVTYHYPPSAGVAVHRALAMTRILPEHGWDVSVVAPTHMRWESVDNELLARVPSGTHVVRRPFPEGAPAELLRRYFEFESWLPSAWNGIREVVETHRIDAVKTTSPPGCVHYLGYWTKRKFGIPWIASFRDPWVTSTKHYNRPGPIKALEKRGEALTMREADLICLNTPTNRRLIADAYPAYADKMFYLTNGFDADAIGRLAGSAPRPAGASGITLLHAGEIYASRDPRPLFEAIRRLRDERPDLGPVRLVCLGAYDDCGFDMGAEIERLGVGDLVEVHGQVPYSRVGEAMRASDILVVLHARDAPGWIPAKTYEYLGSGKPILVLGDGQSDLGWVLRSTAVTHRFASLANAADIGARIAELADEIRSGTARPAAAEKLRAFTREELIASFAARLDRLVAGERRGAAAEMVPG